MHSSLKIDKEQIKEMNRNKKRRNSRQLGSFVEDDSDSSSSRSFASGSFIIKDLDSSDAKNKKKVSSLTF
jgi:hypothetical protein